MPRILIVLLLASLLFGACNQTSKTKVDKITLGGNAIGTRYAISYYDSLPQVSKVEIDSVIAIYNLVFSNYDTTTELMRINRSLNGGRVSAAFIDVFLSSKKINSLTGGAFDPSIGPLIELWGFGKANRPKTEPDSSVVDSVLQLVGLQHWSLIGDTLKKDVPSAQLNFSAIAKGFIVDRVAQFLKSKAIKAAMVEIGGEVVCYGTKPNGKSWNIGINSPKDVSKIYNALKLDDCALATSGNYRNFYEIEGKKYAHTINPQTGRFVEHQLLSASVIASNCATADAYATAFMVMGIDASITFLEKRNDLQVYFIYESNGQLAEWFTPGYKKLMLQ